MKKTADMDTSQAPGAEPMLGVRQAAVALKVGIRQVYNLLYEGKLGSAKKTGMVWQIPAKAVERRLCERGARNG